MATDAEREEAQGELKQGPTGRPMWTLDTNLGASGAAEGGEEEGSGVGVAGMSASLLLKRSKKSDAEQVLSRDAIKSASRHLAHARAVARKKARKRGEVGGGSAASRRGRGGVLG